MASKTTTVKKSATKQSEKAVVTKTPVKTTSKVATKLPTTKVVAPKVTEKVTAKKESVSAKVSVDVFDLTGKVTGKMNLPEEIFGTPVNRALLAQAIRVYLANQRQGDASTKTRSQVTGSTRKIYRQKGTGRARHGAAKAPIFVHGGIAHGPHPKDFSLSLPQKMKQKALFSALSAKLKDGELLIVDGFMSLEPKTKSMATALKQMKLDGKKSVLVVVSDTNQPFVRAIRNIKNARYMPANLLSTYTVMTSTQVLFMKEAVDTMKTHFLKGALK